MDCTPYADFKHCIALLVAQTTALHSQSHLADTDRHNMARYQQCRSMRAPRYRTKFCKSCQQNLFTGAAP